MRPFDAHIKVASWAFIIYKIVIALGGFFTPFFQGKAVVGQPQFPHLQTKRAGSTGGGKRGELY